MSAAKIVVGVSVSEEKFTEILKDKLGDKYDRALRLFREYAPNRSFDFTNVLHLASEQGEDKVEEVLLELEKHYEEHLGHQHPEIRGAITDRLLGVNKTNTMFLNICTRTLGLEPSPA